MLRFIRRMVAGDEKAVSRFILVTTAAGTLCAVYFAVANPPARLPWTLLALVSAGSIVDRIREVRERAGCRVRQRTVSGE